jgi:hypothetical protein
MQRLNDVASAAPNQKMELTTSRRYNLLFVGSTSYPAAMRVFARGSSSSVSLDLNGTRNGLPQRRQQIAL